MYVQHNIKSRSRNNGCRAKAINIKDSECVFVAYVIQLSPLPCTALGLCCEI